MQNSSLTGDVAKAAREGKEAVERSTKAHDSCEAGEAKLVVMRNDLAVKETRVVALERAAKHAERHGLQHERFSLLDASQPPVLKRKKNGGVFIPAKKLKQER